VAGALAVGASLGSAAGWQPPPVTARDRRIGLSQLSAWHQAADRSG